MTKILPGIRTVSSGATEIVSIDETFELDSGEILSGTPTVTEQDTADLTISSKAISTVALTINGNSSAVACAVQFKILGQKGGVLYHVKYSVATTSSPARTLEWIVRIQCR